MARPKKVIDWEQFDELCSILCTQEEIASVLKVSVSTLKRMVKAEKGESFDLYYKKASAGGTTSLRRLQFKAAEGGNVTMLIWLGKQLLGQSDKIETEDKTDYGELMRKVSGNM